jgi:hypothetical protein
MVEIDLRQVLTYPSQGGDATVRTAVGGGLPALLTLVTMVAWVVGFVYERALLLALLSFPLQLVVAVAWTGYFVRVARQTAAVSTEPPPLDGWTGLVRDGVVGSLVGLFYVVPGLVLVVGMYAVAFASVFGMEWFVGTDPRAGLTMGLLGMLVMMVGSLVMMGYAVVAAYLWPASLTLYAVEGSLRRALSPRRIASLVVSGEYAAPWIVVAGLSFWAYFVVSSLTMLLVGYLLVPLLPLLFFYLGTAAFHGFGQAYVGAFGPTGVTGRRSRAQHQDDL